jgi:hypothetical protein
MKEFKKTSFIHRNIGKHEHEVWIFNSYEIYAVCKKCGMHDWGLPKGYKELTISQLFKIHKAKQEHPLIKYFKDKYPKFNLIQEGDRKEGE